MAKKKATLTHRAWSLLRKGGALKRRLMVNLCLVHHSRSPRAGDHPYGDLHHGERELSFDETPTTFRFKIHRPRFPCIEPPINFDDNEDDHVDDNSAFSYFLQKEMKEQDPTDHDEGGGGGGGGSKGWVVYVDEEEQDVDSKAEEFIAKFYERMTLQRQVSLLQYNEMLNRGMS